MMRPVRRVRVDEEMRVPGVQDADECARLGRFELHEIAVQVEPLAVLALAQLLYGADSDDERTSRTLELMALAVGQLLDALEPYVTGQEHEARRVLLDGEPLDAALERLFCA